MIDKSENGGKYKRAASGKEDVEKAAISERKERNGEKEKGHRQREIKREREKERKRKRERERKR